MSILARLMALFPAIHVLLIVLAFGWYFHSFNGISFIGAILATYGFPLAAYRLHQIKFPLKEGYHDLKVKSYSPWWGTYQMQLTFLALPGLEAVLKIIPGAFSFWLRLWGSRVGRRVVWTPQVEILDRGFMDIGDGAIFGHKVVLSGHIISEKDGQYLTYLRRVTIGAGAFIGAGVAVGPGATVKPGEVTKAGKHIYPVFDDIRTFAGAARG